MAIKYRNPPYVIVRTKEAGCFAGNIVSRTGGTIVMTDARRLWYWAGAASLSQLAVSGTSKPSECKFPVAVPRIVLMGVVEIITVTDEAKANIGRVPAWTA